MWLQLNVIREKCHFFINFADKSDHFEKHNLNPNKLILVILANCHDKWSKVVDFSNSHVIFSLYIR